MVDPPNATFLVKILVQVIHAMGVFIGLETIQCLFSSERATVVGMDRLLL